MAALREDLQDINPNKLFAVVPLPHAATTDIFVRQLQALVTPRTQNADDLVDAWIWCFNASQPNQGGVWVPHLGWALTLIAPPTDPRPAPSTGGQERAPPQPGANTLNIPPREDLADWESRTARDRGRNLRSMVERYLPGAGTASRGPPRRGGDPGTIAMIVLDSGHYYQVRISPHPQEHHWSLEAVDSMLPHPCGHLTAVLEFRAFFRFPVARLPMAGLWFTTPWRLVSNPTGLLLRAFGLPYHPMSRSPLPHPVTGPFSASRGFPIPLGCRAAPFHRSSRVYTPPGRQQPCGAGPLDPHPSGDRFVRLAPVAPFPLCPFPLWRVPSPLLAYSPRPAPSPSPGPVVGP